MERRHMVSGGFVAAVAAALGAPNAATAQQRTDADRVVGALEQLRETVDRGFQVSPELARIREQQRTFLRTNHKFPDYIEIGIGVWEAVYDWHIRHHLPVPITRLADGRYAMTVMETALVLRPEQVDTFVGLPFDAR